MPRSCHGMPTCCMLVSVDNHPTSTEYSGDRDPNFCIFIQIAFVCTTAARMRDVLGYGWAPDAQEMDVSVAGHDRLPWSALAPRRNAAMAAGLLRRQSTLSIELNHMNPSRP